MWADLSWHYLCPHLWLDSLGENTTDETENYDTNQLPNFHLHLDQEKYIIVASYTTY